MSRLWALVLHPAHRLHRLPPHRLQPSQPLPRSATCPCRPLLPAAQDPEGRHAAGAEVPGAGRRRAAARQRDDGGDGEQLLGRGQGQGGLLDDRGRRRRGLRDQHVAGQGQPLVSGRLHGCMAATCACMAARLAVAGRPACLPGCIPASLAGPPACRDPSPARLSRCLPPPCPPQVCDRLADVGGRGEALPGRHRQRLLDLRRAHRGWVAGGPGWAAARPPGRGGQSAMAFAMAAMALSWLSWLSWLCRALCPPMCSRYRLRPGQAGAGRVPGQQRNHRVPRGGPIRLGIRVRVVGAGTWRAGGSAGSARCRGAAGIVGLGPHGGTHARAVVAWQARSFWPPARPPLPSRAADV